jgi:hypothetical protein
VCVCVPVNRVGGMIRLCVCVCVRVRVRVLIARHKHLRILTLSRGPFSDTPTLYVPFLVVASLSCNL